METHDRSVSDRRPLRDDGEVREELREAGEHEREAREHRREAARDRAEGAADTAEGDRLEAIGNSLEARGHDIAAAGHERAATHDRREAREEIREAAPAAAERVPEGALAQTGVATATPGQSLLGDEHNRRFRSRWEDIQASFIDEPREAVSSADALVREATEALHSLFERDRRQLEGVWDRGDDVSTEDLRVTLQRYRSFFERLLTI